MSRRNRKRTVLGGIERVGEGDGRRTARVTVDHAVARLLRGVRTGNQLQSAGNVTGPELIDILRVDGIGQPEVLTRLHMRGDRHGNLSL